MDFSKLVEVFEKHSVTEGLREGHPRSSEPTDNGPCRVTASITPSADGTYVDVFIPIEFRRSGGRKTIVAPDGTQIAPMRSKAVDSLTKALLNGAQPATLQLSDLEQPFPIEGNRRPLDAHSSKPLN